LPRPLAKTADEKCIDTTADTTANIARVVSDSWAFLLNSKLIVSSYKTVLKFIQKAMTISVL